QLSNRDDVIRIDNVSGLQVKLNGETFQLDPTYASGTVGTVNVDTRSGTNTVQVAGVAAAVSINIDSSAAGTDTVTVGSDNQSLVKVQGTVTINNNTGSSRLAIDDTKGLAGSVLVANGLLSFVGGPTLFFQGGSSTLGSGSTHGVTQLSMFLPGQDVFGGS